LEKKGEKKKKGIGQSRQNCGREKKKKGGGKRHINTIFTGMGEKGAPSADPNLVEVLKKEKKKGGKETI